MYDEDGFEILDHDQDSYDYPGEVDLDEPDYNYVEYWRDSNDDMEGY
jgi:hypothetical protein